MKNTKTLFLISFFGCFILPLMTVFFATLSIFFSVDFIVAFSNWILFKGGLWILFIYEIIIILITIMLGLTLRLKNVEFITTEKVTKGRKSDVVIKKVKTIEIKDAEKGKRKEVKVPEKRALPTNEVSVVEVRQPDKKVKTVASEPVSQTSTTAPVNKPKQDDKPKPMFSAIKR